MPRERLIDLIHARPESPKAASLRARISVQVRWDEIAETIDAGFPLSWIWEALQTAEGATFGLRTFRAEVARQKALQVRKGAVAIPPLKPSTVVPELADGRAKPPSPAVPAIDDDRLAQPPSDSLPAVAPLPPREKSKGPDDYYFRPKTPEERAARKAAAKARVEAMEAAEAAAAKEGKTE